VLNLKWLYFIVRLFCSVVFYWTTCYAILHSTVLYYTTMLFSTYSCTVLRWHCEIRKHVGQGEGPIPVRVGFEGLSHHYLGRGYIFHISAYLIHKLYTSTTFINSSTPLTYENRSWHAFRSGRTV